MMRLGRRGGCGPRSSRGPWGPPSRPRPSRRSPARARAGSGAAPSPGVVRRRAPSALRRWAPGGARRREQLQPVRGWTEEDWERAAARLADRGWVDSAGGVTPDGAAARQAVEDATDLAAARPWARLGAEATEELAGLLAPNAPACAAQLPLPHPGGVAAPGRRALLS